MAAFCFFWKIDPPTYLRLTLEQVDAMWRFQDDYIAARKKKNRG